MFGLMHLNTFAPVHVFWSGTRAYMALYLGGAMAIIMLSFLPAMYQNRAANITIHIVVIVVFAVSVHLVRSQATIDNVDYMKAMIPHHSIAILTSERANIFDARVRELTDAIIDTQLREIAEMKVLIAELEGRQDGLYIRHNRSRRK